MAPVLTNPTSNAADTITKSVPETLSLTSEIVQSMENTTFHDIFTSTINNVTTTGGEVGQPGINLALIPVVAAVVLTVVGCLKCCQWFRQYSRGNRKDENYYAVIVEDGDEGHVDMPYNDTVSSYNSFLRRPDTSNADFRFPRNEFVDSPRKWLLNKLGTERQASMNSEIDRSGVNQFVPSRRRDRSLNTTSSVSSEDTEVVDLSASDSIQKKSKRFKVSFVGNECETPVRKCTPSAWTGNNNAKGLRVLAEQAVHLTGLPAKIVTTKLPAMVTVATQTNKTCTSSIRNARQNMCINKCDSDTQIDGSPPTFTLYSVSDDSKTNTKTSVECGSDSMTNKDTNSDEIYSRGTSPCYSDGTATDCIDDVFESDKEPDVTMKTSESSCDCNKYVNEDDNKCKRNSNMCHETVPCDKQPSKIQADQYSKSDLQARVPPKDIAIDKDSTKTPPKHSLYCHLKDKCVESSSGDITPTGDHPTTNTPETSTCHDTQTRDINNTECSTSSTRSSPDKSTSNVCYHCGSSLPRKHRRYNSEQSDNKSSSITSLESSGYADELSFDGSDGS